MESEKSPKAQTPTPGDLFEDDPDVIYLTTVVPPDPPGFTRKSIKIENIENSENTEPTGGTAFKIQRKRIKLWEAESDPLCMRNNSPGGINSNASDMRSSSQHIQGSSISSSGSSQLISESSQSSPGEGEIEMDSPIEIKCNKIEAFLYKSKLGSGNRGQCIRLGDQWLTPIQFMTHCGRTKSKDWKRVAIYTVATGRTLISLINAGVLKPHKSICMCPTCTGDSISNIKNYNNNTKIDTRVQYDNRRRRTKAEILSQSSSNSSQNSSNSNSNHSQNSTNSSNRGRNSSKNPANHRRISGHPFVLLTPQYLKRDYSSVSSLLDQIPKPLSPQMADMVNNLYALKREFGQIGQNDFAGFEDLTAKLKSMVDAIYDRAVEMRMRQEAGQADRTAADDRVEVGALSSVRVQLTPEEIKEDLAAINRGIALKKKRTFGERSVNSSGPGQDSKASKMGPQKRPRQNGQKESPNLQNPQKNCQNLPKIRQLWVRSTTGGITGQEQKVLQKPQHQNGQKDGQNPQNFKKNAQNPPKIGQFWLNSGTGEISRGELDQRVPEKSANLGQNGPVQVKGQPLGQLFIASATGEITIGQKVSGNTNTNNVLVEGQAIGQHYVNSSTGEISS